MRIDVGVCDRETLPREHLSGRDMLGFAEVDNPAIVTQAKEEIFADKFLAYAGQGETGMRWRDLVDMQLLIARGLDEDKLLLAMYAAEHREGTAYPTELASPPRHWAVEYSEMAEKCQLPMTLEEACSRLKVFVEPVLEHYQAHQLEQALRQGGAEP